MNMHVYGSSADDSPTVLLIHPMLSSASRMKAAVADHMGDGLRFLIPDLSAHGDEASAPYSSAIEEAETIHSWLVDHGIRRLALGFGASLGGVVFFELLRFPDLSFDRLFIEGRSSQARAAFRRRGRPPHGREPCCDERGEHSGDRARLLAGRTAAPVPRRSAPLHVRVRGERLGPTTRATHGSAPLSAGRAARLAGVGPLRAYEPRLGRLRGDAAQRRPGLSTY